MHVAARIAFDVLLPVLAALFVFARLYVRYHVGKHAATRVPFARLVYSLGDILLVSALIFATTVAALDIQLQLYRRDNDLDRDGVPPEIELMHMPRTLKVGSFNILLSIFSLWFVKFAFLCNYWSAASSLHRTAYRTLIGVTTFTFLGLVVAITTSFTYCRPFSRHWASGPDNCFLVGVTPAVSTTTSFHLSSDIMVMAMGIIIIRMSLGKMGRREWVAIIFIFGLGFLTMVFHCIRFGVLTSIQLNPSLDMLLGSKGKAYDDWMYCSCLAEMVIAQIATSLPALRVWLRISKKSSHSVSASVPDRRHNHNPKVSAESERYLGPSSHVEMVPYGMYCDRASSSSSTNPAASRATAGDELRKEPRQLVMVEDVSRY